MNERLVSTVDVEKALQSGDVDALGELGRLFGQRQLLQELVRRYKDDTTPHGLLSRGVAESGLAALESEGRVSALDALRVERRLIELRQDHRWVVMLAAREEGASWEEIAAALEFVGNNAAKIARDWYAARVEQEAGGMTADALMTARAVIDEQPAADSGEQSSPVAES